MRCCMGNEQHAGIILAWVSESSLRTAACDINDIIDVMYLLVCNLIKISISFAAPLWAELSTKLHAPTLTVHDVMMS